MATQNENDDCRTLIQKWDSLIRQGQLSRAADQIRKFNLQRVPRESRTALANVCRRAGLIGHGLRVLQPIVRQHGPALEKPTPEEVCEYAALLMRNGSLQEATNLLADIDSERLPVSLLYRGFCHVSAWDYGAAAPLFEALLKSHMDDYSKLIALVNLGASLAALNRTSEGLEVINQAIATASKTQALRLVGNCLEIRAQIHMSSSKFTEAKQDLREALAMFDKNKGYDLLLISKNLAFIQALEEKSLEPIDRFRIEAAKRKHWESLREADLFSIKIRFDQMLFDRLIIGSPMPGYRKRVLNELSHTPNDYYLLGSNGPRILDLERGRMDSGSLSPGKKIHLVLGALVADLYAPLNSGALFSVLYPEEYFDIGSSLNRVRQAIYRTRCWLREADLPVDISQEDGDYKLTVAKGDFGIRVPYQRPDLQTDNIRFLDIRKALPVGKRFTVGEACAILNISRSTFHRLAEHGLKTGELRRIGVRRSTEYMLVA